MSTLNVKSSFELSVNGRTITGKQGAAVDDADTAFGITVDGKTYPADNSIADDAVRTLWDEDSNFPQDFDFLFFWADQDVDLQLIGSSGNVTIKVRAKVPFVLGYDDILPAANTTLLSAGVAPTYESIDSVVLANNSGSTANYFMCLVD